METVLNETVRTVSHTTGSNTGVNSHVANMNVRHVTAVRDNANNEENNLNLNSRVLIMGELPDIDKPMSDESYPSNSAYSFNHEADKWDPG